jgi:hypothetical protein
VLFIYKPLVDPDHDVTRLDDCIHSRAIVNFNSSTASLVIEAISLVPFTLIRTWAVVCPFVTSTTVPHELIARAKLH